MKLSWLLNFLVKVESVKISAPDEIRHNGFKLDVMPVFMAWAAILVLVGSARGQDLLSLRV